MTTEPEQQSRWKRASINSLMFSCRLRQSTRQTRRKVEQEGWLDAFDSNQKPSTPAREFDQRSSVYARSRDVCAERFDFEQNACAQPWWQQGDAAFDAPEVVAQRETIMRSRRMGLACRKFWDTLGLKQNDMMSLAQFAR